METGIHGEIWFFLTFGRRSDTDADSEGDCDSNSDIDRLQKGPGISARLTTADKRLGLPHLPAMKEQKSAFCVLYNGIF